MKVSLVMRPGSNLVRGGTEVMVDKTAEELRNLGCEVDFVTPLTRQLGDVVHFFGCFESHWLVADVAAKQSVPIVWTPIYSTPHSVRKEKMRSVRKRVTRTFPRLLQKLADHAFKIISISPKDGDLIQGFFGVEPDRIRRIPHGVDPRFATADPLIFRSRLGSETPFVLHVGMFNEGKNQLGLASALKDTGVPLVFVGAPQDVTYFERCKREAGPNTLFFGEINHDDPLLASAYAAASVFALPSHNEVFPLTVLEAAVAGCGLVLGSTWGADRIYGSDASYCDPAKPDDIRAKVEQALRRGRLPRETSAYYLNEYSWPGVTKQLLQVYEEALETK